MTNFGLEGQSTKNVQFSMNVDADREQRKPKTAILKKVTERLSRASKLDIKDWFHDQTTEALNTFYDHNKKTVWH